jgi:methionyl aminopeptidase
VIIKKTPEEIAKMEAAGAILVQTLALLEGRVRPGVRTSELDAIAERFIRSQGATPTFKGFRGFPGSICASPNAMVVHGIPGRYRLQGGDIISIDVGVTLDGWVADAARTFAVGEVGPREENLLRATRAALFTGVEQCRPGNRVGDVSHAIELVVESAGLSVVRSLVGHGVGRSMHEDPQVPNYGRPGRGPLLEEGMVLAIEPMTTAGQPAVRMGGDGWAIFSQDESPAAHFEFTVAITANGPRILTPWHLHERAEADPAHGLLANGRVAPALAPAAGEAARAS